MVRFVTWPPPYVYCGVSRKCQGPKVMTNVPPIGCRWWCPYPVERWVLTLRFRHPWSPFWMMASDRRELFKINIGHWNKVIFHITGNIMPVGGQKPLRARESADAMMKKSTPCLHNDRHWILPVNRPGDTVDITWWSPGVAIQWLGEICKYKITVNRGSAGATLASNVVHLQQHVGYLIRKIVGYWHRII